MPPEGHRGQAEGGRCALSDAHSRPTICMHVLIQLTLERTATCWRIKDTPLVVTVWRATVNLLYVSHGLSNNDNTPRHGLHNWNVLGTRRTQFYAIFRRHVGQFRCIDSQVSTQLLWKMCAHGRRLRNGMVSISSNYDCARLRHSPHADLVLKFVQAYCTAGHIAGVVGTGDLATAVPLVHHRLQFDHGARENAAHIACGRRRIGRGRR